MDIPQGYKQTELGIIPEDWQLQSVGKYCTVKARIGWQGLRSDEYLTFGEYGLITSTDIVNGSINWGTCYFVSKARYLQDSNIIVQEDDTLISKDGTIGKVGIVQNMPFPSTLNSGVFVIRPKFDSIYKRYLGCIFKSIYFQDFINRLTAGSTIVHLYQKDIVNFIYPVPTLVEQRAIAETLSDIDGLIAALDKKIAKKRLIKQGAMQQLLTGKKRLPGFTGDWIEIRLGDYTAMNSGGTPSSSIPEYYNGDIPFLSISDITISGKYIKKTEKTITKKGLQNSSARMFPRGTIMYAMYASLGKTSIADIELSCSQAILGITPNDKIDSNYLYYCLSSITVEYIRGLVGRVEEDLYSKHYDSVVTKSRTLVEEVIIYILEQRGIPVPTSGNLIELYRECKATLGMLQDKSWDKRILEMLSGLEKIVSAVSGMRNTNSDAHGAGSARIEIKEREARLIVNSAITMCEYILDVYESQK